VWRVPALNYRTLDELRASRAARQGVMVVIIICVNKSNIKYKDQLAVLCEEKVDFIITSFCLRRPSQAHKVGIKVFCDVTDLALPKGSLGADA
jgi:nitronate monooxygenase